MTKNQVEPTVGYAWALGSSAWLCLVGMVVVVIPIGLIFGETAGRWALGSVGALSLGMTWLFAEAVHALQAERGETQDVLLSSTSGRSL